MSVDYRHDKNEMTLGNGELIHNNVGVGYLNGDDAVKFKAGYDLEKFKHGQPKTVKAIFNKESMMELTAPIMQINPGNLALSLGGLNIVSNDGTPVVVSVMQAKTFNNWPAAPGMQALVLDGPTVSSLVVKDSSETITYGATDYILDAATGVLWRVPAAQGGTIPAGATVHVTYHYTPVASQQMNFGNLTSLGEAPLLFRHLRPDKTLVEVFMERAVNTNPLDLDFVGGKLIVMNVQFEALYHEGNDRLGYIKFTPNGSLANAPVYT